MKLGVAGTLVPEVLHRVLGDSAAILPAAEVLAGLRQLVDQRTWDGSALRLDEWEERAWEYGHAVFLRPDAEVIADLSADLLSLQELLPKVPSTQSAAWGRVNAQLAFLMAYELGSAGQARESRHWWAAARHVAEQAGDAEMVAMSASFEAVQGMYERRPLPLVIRRAEEAITAVDNRACRAVASAYGVRAHARAKMGDPRAFADLEEQARISDRLPAEVTGDTASVYGWAPGRY